MSSRPLDGRWLSSPGEYRELVHSLCSADPRLRQRDPRGLERESQWPIPNTTITVLEAQEGGSFSPPIPLDHLSLATYLKSQGESVDPDGRRVYILQGQNPEFIGSLGSFFRIHPSFFVEHERIAILSSDQEGESDGIILPASMMGRQHITLKYFELFGLQENLQNNFYLFCADSGRRIAVTRFRERFSEVGTIGCKCSIWRQPRASGSGWDCIVITDPPLKTVKLKRRDDTYHTVMVSSSSPFQGGYPDFIPHTAQMKIRDGPPRTSMKDDLCFYLTNYWNLLDFSCPDAVALFAKKIICSYYRQQYLYMAAIASAIRWNLTPRSQLEHSQFGPDFVEIQWRDIQALNQRMNEYCTELEANMLQCGISLGEPDMTVVHSWADISVDFKFLYLRFDDIRQRTESLNASITALAGMVANHQALKGQQLSLKEAKSTKALTFLGLVFIPLAYTSSLFSMAGPYGPGSEQFWLYFAIAVPLIAIVISTYRLVDLGYGEKTEGWSAKLMARRLMKMPDKRVEVEP